MTNNKDVELQVLPDLEQHVVIDDPMSSTVAVIVIILLQGPPQDLKDAGQLEQLEFILNQTNNRTDHHSTTDSIIKFVA